MISLELSLDVEHILGTAVAGPGAYTVYGEDDWQPAQPGVHYPYFREYEVRISGRVPSRMFVFGSVRC